LEAHAWIVCRGVVIDQDADIHRNFAVLSHRLFASKALPNA
jgi:hypothetical protein